MMYVKAFVVGGLLCVIAQILIDKTKLTPARILVSYVVAGAILTAIGVYEPLVDFAGAGATVPLTGFGYSLAMGVKKAVAENGLFGAVTGGLTATSGGIAVAVITGVVCAVIFKVKR
ncbi:MAG: stage V sporulation protein AE [Clostridia bacterium]|nr:stage V sporulation protein AE [Clostridia bacterium]